MQEKLEIKRFLRSSMVLTTIICIGVFTFLGINTNHRNETTINQVGGLYMASMNERISKHFSTMIDLRLTQLDTLVETLPGRSREDSAMVREWLEYNGTIRGLEALAYFFEDGSFEMIYGVPASSVNADRFFDSMQNGERKVSVGVDDNGEKVAFIGVPFEITLQDGRKSIAIVGRMPIEYISETLSLDEEDALMLNGSERSMKKWRARRTWSSFSQNCRRPWPQKRITPPCLQWRESAVRCIAPLCLHRIGISLHSCPTDR